MHEVEVLLADDDDVGRYVVATMLRRAGFSVTEATDGAEALELALARPPDLAVLDVKMPTMDGFEACRRLKSHDLTKHVPVLLLSATFVESEAHVEGLETGADAYLTQPVEAPVLAATVRALLRARSAEAEVRLAAIEWKSTFEAISDPVAVLEANGTVLRSNRAFDAVFPESPPGRRSIDLLALRDGDELTEGGRLFRVRADRVAAAEDPRSRGRLVLTLTDITAARASEHQRAVALATERTISRTLQQSLLPERLPRRSHLQLDAWHVAAEKELIVGGDWYDVIEAEDRLWLVIGDVAGHGVAATAQAGQLRHSLRVYAHEGYDLVESLARLNELVCETVLAGMATVCIVAIQDQSDSADLVLAGHPPPLLVPRTDSPYFVKGGLGAVLGFSGAHYHQTSFRFEHGDRLVLYTDGLIERRREDIDAGMARMLESVEGVKGLSGLRVNLLRDLVDLTGLGDDVALLLAQRN